MALTRRQRQVVDFIAGFVESNGYSPSFEEIGSGLELSSLATVHKHISNLEKKGFLRRGVNRSRSIDLVPQRAKFRAIPISELTLPIMGTIAAGKPVETFENPEILSLSDFTKGQGVFVLKVAGESMQDEHIVNGDLIIVEKTNIARNGEIVVALVEGSDTTLKRFYKEGDRIRLQPSNARMQPIMVPAAAVQIQGRVIGVLRRY